MVADQAAASPAVADQAAANPVVADQAGEFPAVPLLLVGQGEGNPVVEITTFPEAAPNRAET